MANKDKEQLAKLRAMIEREREKKAGYEQIAKLHAAYIGILLKRLGATKDDPVEITNADIDEAMKLEVRGYPFRDGWKLYIE